jgi:uncharacterized protein (DUF2141 family)
MISILAMILAAAGGDNTLVVDVSNVNNAKGLVHIDVCDQRRFLKSDCPYAADAPARAGTTEVVVHGVAPGQYAIQAYHDENGNHRVDRLVFGIPKEGIGFSRDARIKLGPPKWEDAVFAFNGSTQRTAFPLHYFLGGGAPR